MTKHKGSPVLMARVAANRRNGARHQRRADEKAALMQRRKDMKNGRV